MATLRKTSTLQTLDRGLQVLELLAKRELGPTDLARAVCVDRASIHRILRTLIEKGFVERVDAGGRYRANLRHLLSLAGEMTAEGEANWLVLAKSHLEELNSATGLSANFCVPSGNEMVYLVQVLGEGLSVRHPPGTRRPLHASAVGKAYLGSLPQAKLDALLPTLEMRKFTPSSITSVAELKSQLQMARLKGYYVDRGEFSPRIQCLAAPVFDQFGSAIASVGVSGPVEHSAYKREAELGALIVDIARRMSIALGYGGEKIGAQTPERSKRRKLKPVSAATSSR